MRVSKAQIRVNIVDKLGGPKADSGMVLDEDHFDLEWVEAKNHLQVTTKVEHIGPQRPEGSWIIFQQDVAWLKRK